MEVARICWHSCIIRKNIGLRFSSLGKMAWKWRRWRNSILLFMAYCTLMCARPTISGQGKTPKYIHSTSLMFSVCILYNLYVYLMCKPTKYVISYKPAHFPRNTSDDYYEGNTQPRNSKSTRHYEVD